MWYFILMHYYECILIFYNCQELGASRGCHSPSGISLPGCPRRAYGFLLSVRFGFCAVCSFSPGARLGLVIVQLTPLVRLYIASSKYKYLGPQLRDWDLRRDRNN